MALSTHHPIPPCGRGCRVSIRKRSTVVVAMTCPAAKSGDMFSGAEAIQRSSKSDVAPWASGFLGMAGATGGTGGHRGTPGDVTKKRGESMGGTWG